jgi:hypothetical protein
MQGLAGNALLPPAFQACRADDGLNRVTDVAGMARTFENHR